MMESMRLYVYPFGLDLCAIDSECLSVMIYSSLVLSPGTWKIIELNDAGSLVSGRLPSLHDLSADMWYGGFEDISRHLRRLGLDHEAGLESIENSNTQVQLHNLLEQAKNVTALSMFTVELLSDRYSGERTTNIVASSSGNQLSAVLYRQLQSRRLQIFRRCTQGTKPDHSRRELQHSSLFASHAFLLDDAVNKLYSVLEARLTATEYVFAERINIYDVELFGHLALHCTPHIPNNPVSQLVISKYPRTNKYLLDMNAKYLDKIRRNGHSRVHFDLTDFMTASLMKPRGFVANILPNILRRPSGERTNREAWAPKAAFISGTVAFMVGFMLFNRIVVLSSATGTHW